MTDHQNKQIHCHNEYVYISFFILPFQDSVCKYFDRVKPIIIMLCSKGLNYTSGV